DMRVEEACHPLNARRRDHRPSHHDQFAPAVRADGARHDPAGADAAPAVEGGPAPPRPTARGAPAPRVPALARPELMPIPMAKVGRPSAVHRAASLRPAATMSKAARTARTATSGPGSVTAK